jgi:hypothetical protein
MKNFAFPNLQHPDSPVAWKQIADVKSTEYTLSQNIIKNTTPHGTVLISAQNGSTPGVYLQKDIFRVAPGLKYKFLVVGYSFDDAHLIVTDYNYKPILWPGPKLKSTIDTTELIFDLPPLVNEVRFGVLLNEPREGAKFTVLTTQVFEEKTLWNPYLKAGVILQMSVLLFYFLFLRKKIRLYGARK